MTGGGDQPQEKWEEKLSLEPDFIDDVDQYLTTHKIENVDVLIERLQQKLQMYTMAENRALTRRQKQMERQAHLDKSVACVRMLLDKQESKEDAIVDYSLGDVMAEYPLEDAQEILDSTLSECVKNLEENHEEWGKVKDCKTTTEVNIARCYNYSVEKKRLLKKIPELE